MLSFNNSELCFEFRVTSGACVGGFFRSGLLLLFVKGGRLLLQVVMVVMVVVKVVAVSAMVASVPQ